MKVPLPDVIDLAVISRLMSRLEAQVHRDGWSQGNDHLHLFILYDHTVPEMTESCFTRLFQPVLRDGHYSIGRMAPGRTFDRPGVRPDEALRKLVMVLAYEQDDQKVVQTRDRLSRPGVMAMLTSHEAYMRNITLEEYEQDDMRPFSEYPDAEEIRVVTAIDAWDRAHLVTRKRGHKPTIDMDGPIRGDISTSLRIFVDMIYGRTPSLDNFDEHYPLLKDAVRRAYGRSDGDLLPPDPSRDHQPVNL